MHPPRLQRQEDGTFKDEELAAILYTAYVRSVHWHTHQTFDILFHRTENPAHAFGARSTPGCMRLHEIMGIMQARKWGVCSLNDFRKVSRPCMFDCGQIADGNRFKFLGLKRAYRARKSIIYEMLTDSQSTLRSWNGTLIPRLLMPRRSSTVISIAWSCIQVFRLKRLSLLSKALVSVQVWSFMAPDAHTY